MFFPMCGEAKQSGSKKGKEGTRRAVVFKGVVAYQLLYLLCSFPFSALSLKPLTLPSGRYRSVIPGMLEITIASQ